MKQAEDVENFEVSISSLSVNKFIDEKNYVLMQIIESLRK